MCIRDRCYVSDPGGLSRRTYPLKREQHARRRADTQTALDLISHRLTESPPILGLFVNDVLQRVTRLLATEQRVLHFKDLVLVKCRCPIIHGLRLDRSTDIVGRFRWFCRNQRSSSIAARPVSLLAK